MGEKSQKARIFKPKYQDYLPQIGSQEWRLEKFHYKVQRLIELKNDFHQLRATLWGVIYSSPWLFIKRKKLN